MSELTALDVAIARDVREMKARQTVDALLHQLRDFIPQHSFRAAREELRETILALGIEIVSQPEMDELRAWRKLKLEMPTSVLHGKGSDHG